MNDKELLELAAKAAGLDDVAWFDYGRGDCGLNIAIDSAAGHFADWNPLTDDGDALRLAVKLEMALDLTIAMQTPADVQATSAAGDFDVECSSDPYAATRRAIVIAAAEIGKEMK